MKILGRFLILIKNFEIFFLSVVMNLIIVIKNGTYRLAESLIYL